MTMKHISSLVVVAALLAAGSACADTIRNPTAIFAGLDKITGRIISFDVTVDETVQFGTLQITPRICLTRPQTEAPLTEGFVEVDEIDSAKQAKRVFSGWMFAASPGLHGVEHPVYDVWLKDCKGGVEVTAAPPGVADVDAPPPANAAPAPKGAVPGRKARTITPQNPVEPSVDDLGAPPPPPSDAPALASPPPAPDNNGLGAPVEVGPAPGAGRAQPDGTLTDPSQPVPPKPKPKAKRKPPAPVQPLDAPPPGQAPQQERAPQQQERAPLAPVLPNILPKFF
jgi:hypothetical protein